MNNAIRHSVGDPKKGSTNRYNDVKTVQVPLSTAMSKQLHAIFLRMKLI
jgi:hypothetical protein